MADTVLTSRFKDPAFIAEMAELARRRERREARLLADAKAWRRAEILRIIARDMAAHKRQLKAEEMKASVLEKAAELRARKFTGGTLVNELAKCFPKRSPATIRGYLAKSPKQK